MRCNLNLWWVTIIQKVQSPISDNPKTFFRFLKIVLWLFWKFCEVKAQNSTAEYVETSEKFMEFSKNFLQYIWWFVSELKFEYVVISIVLVHGLCALCSVINYLLGQDAQIRYLEGLQRKKLAGYLQEFSVVEIDLKEESTDLWNEFLKYLFWNTLGSFSKFYNASVSSIIIIT